MTNPHYPPPSPPGLESRWTLPLIQVVRSVQAEKVDTVRYSKPTSHIFFVLCYRGLGGLFLLVPILPYTNVQKKAKTREKKRTPWCNICVY
ncbi:uncharacterized protein H6S33_012309 [Morchella sextelata]|uniref:uncharacterized protein n=1 Tax=Morchella sextelata TaxID=1174677 RepID=UPI001D045C25|nr:uncharacterized protein H6S33_012309 [Morchella sextelata]KAH0609763.1 hypothetical protein H6S33_012309 [Morchella sextelata]